MSEIGAVEYMIVSFPGNRLTGEIGPALQRLTEASTIRIVDLAFVCKNADGSLALSSSRSSTPTCSAASTSSPSRAPASSVRTT